MTMREAAGPTTSAAPSAGTPSRGARLLGRAAATFTRHGWRDERRPGTGLDPAPDEPVAGMGWHQVGSSHVAGAADGCYEVRCVRDLRWEAVFVPATGTPPQLIEGRGTIFRSFDEALCAVEAFDHGRRHARRAARRPGAGVDSGQPGQGDL